MLKPSGTIAGRFIVGDPVDDMALVNADSLPVGALLENGDVDGAVTVTVSNVSTGIYKYTATVPSDWTTGTNVAVQITATINTKSYAAVGHKDMIEKWTPSDLAGDVTTSYVVETHGLSETVSTSDMSDAIHDSATADHRDVGSTGFTAEQYWVDYQFNSDGVTDEYRCITWFFGADEVTSGITSPTIQVIDGSDDSDLIAETAISKTGSSEMYEHDETSNLAVSGTPYKVRFTATIAGEARTFAESFTR